MLKKAKINVIIVIFLAIGAGSAMAIEGEFYFRGLNTDEGWYPWACVAEQGIAYDGEKNPNLQYCSHNMPESKKAMCPCKLMECPFEELTYRGNACGSWSVQSPLITGAIVQLTIPEDIKLVSSDGFVLEGDVCPGEKPVVTTGNRTGEWWRRGGVYDTPPIQWVDDVAGLVKRIVQFHRDKAGERLADSAVLSREELFTDEFGILVHPETRGEPDIPGNIICSRKEKGSTPSSAAGEPMFGNEADVEADIFCFYYIYGYGGGNQILKAQIPTVIIGDKGFLVNRFSFLTTEDFFRAGTVKFQKKLKVVQPTEAKLEVKSFAGPPDGSERLTRLVITNKGNGKASIGKLTIRGKEVMLTCDDKELQAGESSECVAILDRNDRNMRLAYSEQPCGKPSGNVIAINLDIGQAEEGGQFCDSNSDCSTGEECCASLCRVAAEGVCDDIDSDGVLDTWVPFGWN